MKFKALCWSTLFTLAFLWAAAGTTRAQPSVVSDDWYGKIDEGTVRKRGVDGKTFTITTPAMAAEYSHPAHETLYYMEAQTDGQNTTITVTVMFDNFDKLKSFTSVRRGKMKRLPVLASNQFEADRLWHDRYRVQISESEMDHVPLAGEKWVFRGPRKTCEVEISSRMFSALSSEVKRVKRALQAGISVEEGDNSPFRSFGRRYKSEPEDWFGEVFYLLPPQTGSRDVSPVRLAGKLVESSPDQEIQLFGLAKTTRRDKYFDVLVGEKKAPAYLVNHQSGWLWGLVRKADIDEAKRLYLGRTLFLKTNCLQVLEPFSGRFRTEPAARLQPLVVTEVTTGVPGSPVRLMLQGTNGVKYFQQYVSTRLSAYDSERAVFDELFYRDDPREVLGLNGEIIGAISESKVQFGMTGTQVRASWGEPDKKLVLGRREAEVEIWVYGAFPDDEQHLRMENGVYVDYQKFR